MIHMSRISAVLLAAWALGATACGASTVTVPKPTPSVTVSKKATGSVKLDLDSITTKTVCSKPKDLPELCVARFRGAFEEGLQEMLAGFVEAGQGNAYQATFKLLEFTHAPASGDAQAGAQAATVALAWRFTLNDPSGRPVAALDERTEGPTPVTDWSNPDPAVVALVNAVLEKIGTVLGAASWSSP